MTLSRAFLAAFTLGHPSRSSALMIASSVPPVKITQTHRAMLGSRRASQQGRLVINWHCSEGLAPVGAGQQGHSRASRRRFPGLITVARFEHHFA
jgi:hypothetical protein